MDDTLFPRELFAELAKSQQGLSKFGSIALYGDSVQREERHEGYKVLHLKNESGVGQVTIYPVFPGIELAYNDMHMRFCEAPAKATGQVVEIIHCLQGRYECPRELDYCYMEPGDFSLSLCSPEKRTACFPLSHYHGIRITIDKNQLDTWPFPLLECLSINFQHILSLLADRPTYILQADPPIAQIFSQLYTVREEIRAGYLKVKVLELLLILGDLRPREPERPQFSREQIDAVSAIHDFILDHIAEHYTLEELASRFNLPPTVMKTCFKGVYGDSIYTHLKKCRLELSAQLLAVGDKSVGEVASFLGYDNPVKFASAFKLAHGVSPRDYQKSRSES